MTSNHCQGCGSAVTGLHKWCPNCWPKDDVSGIIARVVNHEGAYERRKMVRRAERNHTGRRHGEYAHPFPTNEAEQIVAAAVNYLESVQKNHDDKLDRLERLGFLVGVQLTELTIHKDKP